MVTEHRSTSPKLMKYIGNDDLLIYGKTYFIKSISSTQYGILSHQVDHNIHIDLIVDTKDNFIEPDKFRTHVIELLLSQTTD